VVNEELFLSYLSAASPAR